MNRIKVGTDDLPWQAAQEVWPGYRFGDFEGSAAPPGPGVFVKVLRRPEDGGGCWCALLRFLPPEGRAIRVRAIAASDEEVFIVFDGSGNDRSGSFTCNPEGLRHGNTFVADTIAFVHYHGQPDEVLGIEVTDLSDVAA